MQMIPTEPLVVAKYFDFISLGVLIVVITLLLLSHRKQHGSVLGTISETVGATKKAHLIFAVSMSIFAPMYYAFVWFWVGPVTDMPRYFYYILGTAFICELLFIWFPARDNRGGKIHKWTASFVGLVMFIIPLILAIETAVLSPLAKYSLVVFFATSLTLLGLMFTKTFRKNTFLFECIYCLASVGTISIIAHT